MCYICDNAKEKSVKLIDCGDLSLCMEKGLCKYRLHITDGFHNAIQVISYCPICGKDLKNEK